MPYIHRRPAPQYKWIAFVLLSLAVAVMIWSIQAATGEPTRFLPSFYMLFALLQIPRWGVGTHLILAGGALLRLTPFAGHAALPLQGAQLVPEGSSWTLRWSEGRITRKQRFTTPAEVRERVEAAILEAQAASPGQAPLTVREAERAVLLVLRSGMGWSGTKATQGLLVVLALMVGAIWLPLPWLLLPIPVFALLADRLLHDQRVLVAGDHLYVIAPDGALTPIPLAHVTAVQGEGVRAVVITTGHPEYPVLKVLRYSGQIDIEPILRKRLAGAPPVPPRQEAPPALPADGLRCSLCGRVEPGAVATGAVYICDRCAGRARVEAAEGGHGLTGREPKPM